MSKLKLSVGAFILISRLDTVGPTSNRASGSGGGGGGGSKLSAAAKERLAQMDLERKAVRAKSKWEP